MSRTNAKTYEPCPSSHVAFVGLGVMGYPMAGHLALAGHSVTVYNRNPAKSAEWCKEFAQTKAPRSAPTPREAAANADVVFVCVGNDNDLRSVMLGDDGVLAGLKAGATVVDHTTALPTWRVSLPLWPRLRASPSSMPPSRVARPVRSTVCSR